MRQLIHRIFTKMHRLLFAIFLSIKYACFILLKLDRDTGFKVNSQYKHIKLGSDYGGWYVPENILNKNSICYCVGAGEDITFDYALIDRFQCTVHTFDPTPKAIEHFKIQNDNRITYHPYGIWSLTKKMKFFAPKNPTFTSHAIIKTQNTDKYFEAECKTIKDVMQELKHNKINLLKIDVEGAEYEIIDSILKDKIDIKIFCVEFDELYLNSIKSFLRIRNSIKKLQKAGYILLHKSKQNYVFIKKN